MKKIFHGLILAMIVLNQFHCDIFYPSQGSISKPQEIKLSELPFRKGTVNASRPSYYKITGLTSKTIYPWSINNYDNLNADLIYYGSDSTFTTPLCTAPQASPVDGTKNYHDSVFCGFAVLGDVVYIKVETAKGGGAFSFSLDEFYTYGTKLSPILIPYTVLPINGAVDSALLLTDGSTSTGSHAYYKIMDLANGGNSYHLSITDLTDDADMDTSSINCSNTRYGTNSESCNYTPGPNDTSLLVHITGKYTASGATFTLNMRTQPVSDGTLAAPSILNFYPGFTLTGQLSPSTSGAVSYYQMNGLSAGSTYVFSVTGMTSNVNLIVNGTDSTFTTVACSSSLMGTSNETCSWTATAPNVYIKILGIDTQGAYFNLQVQ